MPDDLATSIQVRTISGSTVDTSTQDHTIDDGSGAVRRRTALAALVVSVAGATAVLPALPEALRALLLLAFVLVGPGSAVLAWVVLPAGLQLSVTPAIGLATVLGATAVATTVAWWEPVALLVVLTVACAVSAGAALLWRRTGAVPA